MPLLLVLLAGASTTLAVRSHSPAFSPMDEYNYFDYLTKLPGEPFVRTGEYIDLPTRQRLACAGVIGYGIDGPTCGADLSNPRWFVFGGKNSASTYTPVFFWLDWAAGRAIQAIIGVPDLVAFRLTGGLWLAAALIVFWLLLRRLRVPAPVILGLGLVLIAAPFTWLANTFLSTDASVLLIGALMPLAALKIADREWPAWVFPVLAVVASLLKVTHVVPVLIGGAILVSLTVRRSRRPLLAVAGGLAAFVAVQLGWQRMQAALAVAAPPDQLVPSVPLTPSVLVRLAVDMVYRPINASMVAPARTLSPQYPMPAWLTFCLGALCVVGVLGPFLVRKAAAPALAALRLPVVLAVPLAPVVLAVGMAVNDRYFDLPERYGAGSVPVVLLMAGLLVRSRWAGWPVLAFGAGVLAWNIGDSVALLAR